jgi:hypothetical protein
MATREEKMAAGRAALAAFDPPIADDGRVAQFIALWDAMAALTREEVTPVEQFVAAWDAMATVLYRADLPAPAMVGLMITSNDADTRIELKAHETT